ncbi:unnamed protein product [Pieris brassicae]|uniref:Uncharacterized protein n=1 Tax=Pieris brassicae TaxID=7116 RepID=A0A9P0SS03_PIEBR|nr:unnamed protein product [Pieris brassicae]
MIEVARTICSRTKRMPLAISLTRVQSEKRALAPPARPSVGLNQSAAIFCSPESRATVRALITITRRRHLAARGCRSRGRCTCTATRF